MRRTLKALALAFTLCVGAARAQGIVDQYGPLVQWRQPSGFEVTPIHTGLLPNGRLFFASEYNYNEHPEVDLMQPGFLPEFFFTMPTTPASAAPPSSVLIQPMSYPAPMGMLQDLGANSMHMKSLTCSGHALLADGNLFFASGSEAIVNMTLYDQGDLFGALTVNGIAESLTYRPATNTFTSNPPTLVPAPQTHRPLRWYATVTRLADTRMLVTGGYEKVSPVLEPNTSTEVFDPATNAWTAVTQVAQTPPGVENPDYPHVFQTPYGTDDAGKVLVVGGSGEAMFLTMAGNDNTWYRTGKFRPGAKEFIDASPDLVFPNHRASSTLLPLRLPESSWGYANGSILYAGGEEGTPMAGAIDVYDPVVNAWRPSTHMHGLRHDPATVLLPDGRVLILAGYDNLSTVSRTGFAEYVDPRNNFSVTQGTARMPETRGYHTVAVLLPDGRVMLGGGNVAGEDAIERSDFRYYYPDYMSKPRPRTLFVQPAISIGGWALVTVPHGTSVSEAAVMGLGSMTHAFDMNQRHVQLRVTNPGITMRSDSGRWVQADASQCAASGGCFDLLYLQAPATRQLAPPGDYMLFVLDANRVPSEGQMVRLQ